MKKLLLPLLTLTATLMAARPLPPYAQIVPNMAPSAWDILYSKGAGKIYQYGTGWGYNFPGPNGQVGYIMQNTYGYIPVCTATQTVTLEATVDIVASPDAVFDFRTNPDNTGNMPASTRFYVEYHWSDELYVRWWATGNNCIYLGNGQYQYSVPIDPAYWSDAYGQRGDSSPEALAGFYQSFAHVQRFGFTDGGGSFYGHGVRMSSGTASFNVSHIQIRTVSIP